MDHRHDIDGDEEDDDFESTHTHLEAYAREGRATQAGLERLKWERKAMRRIQKLEESLRKLQETACNSVRVAEIVSTEMAMERKFIATIVSYRTKIINTAIAAAVTGIIAWEFAQHGVKVP